MSAHLKMTMAEMLDEMHAMQRRGRPWPQCRTCDGKGEILRDVLYADETPYIPCRDCNGTGRRAHERES